MKTLVKETTVINEESILFPIIPNGLGWVSTEDDHLSVIESGEKRIMLSKIINAIDKAKEMVCLQSFLIQDTELITSLINAVKQRNIKVFVLSSAEARLKIKIEEETDFIKENYIQLLETKFKNHFVHRVAENFHAKYILVDPKTNPKGFICTNNFTENGFVKNPELAIELDKEECEELFKIFVYHFWEYSTDEQTATNEFDKVKPSSRFTLPKLQQILLTSPNTNLNSLNEMLLSAINKANKSISFSTFQLNKNTELVKTILDKARQKIEVILFCRPIEKLFNEQLKDLLDAGIQIFFHPLIHAKSLLIDEENGFIFTANLVENGLEKGLEVGVELNEQQTIDLSKIHQSWKTNFQLKAIQSIKVKDLKEIEVFENGKLVKKNIHDEEKEEKRKVNKVSDLIAFFNQKFHLNDNFIKSKKYKLTAEIDELPENVSINGTDKFEVIEIIEKKDKKLKAIVLKETFQVEDIPLLDEFKEYRLYL